MGGVAARCIVVKSIRNEGDLAKNPSTVEPARVLAAWGRLVARF
jgi:hypothetical protein